MQALQQRGQWGLHRRLPASGTAFELLSPHIGLERELGFLAGTQAQDGAQEVCFLGPRMDDVGLLLAQGESKLIVQEGLDFLFDLFGEGMASPDPNDPVIGIPQVLDPNKSWIVYL